MHATMAASLIERLTLVRTDGQTWWCPHLARTKGERKMSVTVWNPAFRGHVTGDPWPETAFVCVSGADCYASYRQWTGRVR